MIKNITIINIIYDDWEGECVSKGIMRKVGVAK